MAALNADEQQKGRRRNRLLKGLALGAVAVGIPALMLRRSTRRIGTLPRLDWGRSHTYRWRGHSVSFQRLGAGRPIVLLHSLGPGHDATEWHRVAEALSRRWEVFAPDLPGWGRSAETPFRPVADDYVAFVRDFVEGVVREPAVLVAAQRSAGFAVAAVASGLQARALGLVVPRGLGPENHHRGTADWIFRRLIRAPVVGSSAIEMYVTRAALERHLRHEVYAAPERVDAALLRHHYAASHQPGSIQALEAYLAGDLDHEIGSALANLGLPIWIAWGRQSKAPPVEVADLWLRQFPAARLDVIEGCGLLPHAEEPTALGRRLIAFLETLDR